MLLSCARQLGHIFIGFVCFVNIWMEDIEWIILYKVCCQSLFYAFEESLTKFFLQVYK